MEKERRVDGVREKGKEMVGDGERKDIRAREGWERELRDVGVEKEWKREKD